MKDLFIKIRKQEIWYLNWPFFIFYYYLLRLLLGLTYEIIYLFVIILITVGISFEYCALIFFIIALIAYCFGSTIEANHYMSFVYGFIFFSVIKYFYFLFKERFQKK